MLFFYKCLIFLPFLVSGEESISYACVNDSATITFKIHKDIIFSAKYTLITDNDEPKPIASVLKNDITYHNEFKGKILVDAEGNLQIHHVTEKHAGKYKLQIFNGGTSIQFATLKVLVPPSGPPEIKQKSNERGDKVFFCGKPQEPGKPEADVVLKDNLGNLQNQSEFTVNDNEYQCCLEGKSVNMCYAKHLQKCQKSYITENNGALQSKDIQECKRPGFCVVIGLIPFVSCGLAILIYVCFLSRGRVYVLNETGNANGFDDISASWKFKRSDLCNGLRRRKANILLSVVFLVLSCGYFCSAKDCENVFLMLLVGVICVFCAALPSLGSMFNKNVIELQLQEINRDNKVSGNRVEPEVSSESEICMSTYPVK